MVKLRLKNKRISVSKKLKVRLVDKKKKKKTPKPLSTDYQILNSSYQSLPDAKKNMSQRGFEYEPHLSNSNTRTYHNKTTGKTIQTHRGTQNMQDVKTDVALGAGQLRKTERYKKSKALYDKTKKEHPGGIELYGHSLGGSLASELGQKDDKIKTLNKGVAPKDSRKKQKSNEIAARNKGDLVSVFGAASMKKGGGKFSINPLKNHSTSVIKHKELENF